LVVEEASVGVVLLYLAIPVTSALVGWGTNVLAIKMMFFPLEAVGKPPFLGWQGIIPAKVRKMATICVEMILGRLISVREMFDRLDPLRVAEELRPLLEQTTERVVAGVISEQYPRLWEGLPAIVKERTYKRLHKELPVVVEEIMQELQLHIEEICDVRQMVIEAFVRDKALLNALFLRCGSKEFEFIGRSGLYFGFLFGLVQMGIWIVVKPWWLLPLAGLIVGYATNWLALKMVFEPREPMKFGPFAWQGLFLKRQREVSQEYAAIFAREVLNGKNLIEAILRGPAADRLFSVIEHHLKRAIDESSGYSKPLIQVVAGTAQYIAMKERIAKRVIEEMPMALGRLHQYTDEALGIEETLRNKMNELPPADFEGILRPIFQEDEWILIAVGALLGLLVGFAQLGFMF